MLHFQRIWQLAQFELNRLFGTKRGWIALAVFASVWFSILRYAILNAVEAIQSEQFGSMALMFSSSIAYVPALYWKEAELGIYWVASIFMLPLFALFVSAEQTVSDRVNGTLRFISLRASYTEIVIGRWLGQTLNISILTIFSAITSWGLMLFRDPSLAGSGLVLLLPLIAELILIVLPFIALSSLFNTFTRSSKMTLIYVFFAYAIVLPLMAYAVDFIPALDFLFHFFPGSQLGENSVMGNLYERVAIPLVHTAILLYLAVFILRKRGL